MRLRPSLSNVKNPGDAKIDTKFTPWDEFEVSPVWWAPHHLMEGSPQALTAYSLSPRISPAASRPKRNEAVYGLYW